MVREFELPDVGEGLAEAEIVSWLVEEGDEVSEDQPVAEVETDKAVVEVPSPVNGTVAEILAEEGELVPVGTVIITFAVEGETEDHEPVESDADEPAESEASTEAEAAAETDAEDADGEAGGRVFASPATRRIAREEGVDISTVEGSGPGGRVTEADVRTAADSGDEGDDEIVSATREIDDTPDEGTVEEPPAGAASTGAADRDRTLAAPATRKLAAENDVDIDSVPTDRTKDGEAFVTPAEVEAYADAQRSAQAADADAVSAAGRGDVSAPAGDERIPYRGIRRTIGERMERSKYTAPHATHHDEADVTDLVEVRSRLKERAEARGSRLSYVPFVIKAVLAGFREYPILNSQLDEENDEILVRGERNIGVATATDAGLMVPVVDDVDRKGLLEIADEMNGLIEAARDRSISVEEMRGGTFSITNFGAIGGEYATPIINYPETAILGLGAIKEKPRVVDSEAGSASDGANGEAVSKEVVPRKVMTLSLSIDHRVIDGAEAAGFTNVVREHLESPELLLLE